MDLICNELSYHPLAKNNIEAERRFTQLLKTFKAANDRFGFKQIRFHLNYSEQLITAEKNFAQWVSHVSNSTLKNTILTFCKRPFADELEEEELEIFFQSEYKIIDEAVPVNEDPVGLPIAYIKATLAISFDSHEFWRNRKMNILKTNTAEIENLEFVTYNLCLETDVESNEPIEWADNVYANKIETEGMLIKYLSYSKYRIAFENDFMKQLLEWKETDRTIYKYTLLLMKDVQLHPFTGGMGKTENLKNRGKEASKRITLGDRLSYKVENNTVTFIACKGHYDFH